MSKLEQLKELMALISEDNESSSEKHGAIGKVCIVRTYASGVHYGLVKSVKPNDGRSRIEIKFSRRIWYWEGAFTLSKLAINGLPKDKDQKLSCVVPIQYIEDVIEMIPLSDSIVEILDSIPTHIGSSEE